MKKILQKQFNMFRRFIKTKSQIRICKRIVVIWKLDYTIGDIHDKYLSKIPAIPAKIKIRYERIILRLHGRALRYRVCSCFGVKGFDHILFGMTYFAWLHAKRFINEWRAVFGVKAVAILLVGVLAVSAVPFGFAHHNANVTYLSIFDCYTKVTQDLNTQVHLTI